ncbi:MAG TPA: alginate export family protein [Pirellulales bacterium]|nr:alginate export family protein [Pirellulales bacterium]
MHCSTGLIPSCGFERNEFRATTAVAIMAAVALVCPVANGQQPAPPESPSAVADEPAEVQEEAETPQRATPQTARPAVEAYKRLYYDNDFTYLNDPANDEFYLGDVFKQWRVGRRSMLDLGGEYRLRDHHEFNLRGRNLSGQSDDFLLQRTRFYGNLKIDDGLRLYGEALDSATSFQRHTPLASEENGIEALNLFADLRLVDAERGELWGRVGRQELAYGNERLVSPAEWNNVLRTFDGAKLYWRGKNWDIDGFWTRPVAFGILTEPPRQPDHLDMTQNLYGLYSTYKPPAEPSEVAEEAERPQRRMNVKQTFDFYYLGLNVYGAPISPAYPVDANFQTMGTRWQGRRENLLWEFEGAYQFGTYGSQLQSAGMTVTGLGYEFAERRRKPRVWLYYDWASGDANPSNGRHGTFNQLFPWAHRYLGWMDLVGRENIRDLNLQFTLSPWEKTNFTLWYHVFHLAQSRDALYNAFGTPIRISPTGAAGAYVGQELDLLFQIVVNPRVDVLFGYSYFFGGSFIKATNPAGVSGNADFYYSQWSWRF